MKRMFKVAVEEVKVRMKESVMEGAVGKVPVEISEVVSISVTWFRCSTTSRLEQQRTKSCLRLPVSDALRPDECIGQYKFITPCDL